MSENTTYSEYEYEHEYEDEYTNTTHTQQNTQHAGSYVALGCLILIAIPAVIIILQIIYKYCKEVYKHGCSSTCSSFHCCCFPKETKYKTYIMNSNIDKEKYNECTICLESFDNDQIICQLSCDHCFHKDCLDQWINETMRSNQECVCPLCRTSFV